MEKGDANQDYPPSPQSEIHYTIHTYELACLSK